MEKDSSIKLMGTKIRIAIIISHPIQHFCPQYASYAAHQGWHIKVFFASTLGVDSYQDKDFGKSIQWSNLYLDQFDHIFLNNRQNHVISPYLDAPDLDQALVDYDPHVVMVSGYSQKFQRRAFSWANAHKKLIFYSADSERMHHSPWWKEIIKYPFLIQYFKKVNRVLSVGNANEFYYQHYGVPLKKMTRVGFSIDIRLYEDFSKKRTVYNEDTRQKLSIPNTAIVLSVVGKFIKRKRHIDLIQALILLEQISPLEYHLLLIGSGELQEELKATAANKLQKNRVHFTGFVHPEQLPELYAATDIYTHPSEMEPHSLAISEAIFLGCPVVVSDRCGSYGTHDDVQQGANGFVYSCGDITALANKIKLLGENSAMRLQFSQNATNYAKMSQNRAHGLGLEAALRAEGFNLES